MGYKPEKAKQIATKTVSKTPNNGYDQKPIPSVMPTPSMSGGATKKGSHGGSTGPAPDAYPDVHQ